MYKLLCPIDKLPHPVGSLSSLLTLKIISEFNAQIRKAFAWSEGKKRGDYTKHSYEEKAIIA